MKTVRLTAAQALVRFLAAQHVERDGVTQRFFGRVAGIFGHGNVAGIGQALQETPALPFVPVRNEQAAVHMAVGWARMRNRLGAWACTSSVGPGATNMVTGAALATINRLPVLLLPGDVFARRHVAPLLQQLEVEGCPEATVNDCFRPVSRFWDRIQRPEQLLAALPEALAVLTSPARCGAVTLALPQDVQAEAFDVPAPFLEERCWHVPRPRPDRDAVGRVAALLRASRRPLIIAGGGVIYSEAGEALAAFAEARGVPVAVTQAGKAALPSGHELCVGGVGVTGTRAANHLARDADLVLGVGTRFSDFTTASATLFQDPGVRFASLNVAEADTGRLGAVAVTGDAREALDALAAATAGYQVPEAWGLRVGALRRAWADEARTIVSPRGGALPSQPEVLAALNGLLGPRDVVVNAAGSAPGDLHKLWEVGDPFSYQVEYGYSCMGYELPASLGMKLAAPDREVVALVGDGTWLMMNGDLATAVQEGAKIVVVLLDNHGYASIGGLSAGLGSGGFGTEARTRGAGGALDGPVLPVDYAANAASLGAEALRVRSVDELRAAWPRVRASRRTTVLVMETDREARSGGCDAWWDVPVAEVSRLPAVQAARQDYEARRVLQRRFHGEVKE
ncbi:MAG: 3D-(3,5/4)-trihydroxycyclohexane-1,2-dione acylhydrolase (decyclizing) [Deltaproteobacteria bacterium]|nr:3D-(3,5/4)-trihydroxycyclohexane-1,2-dione acylhydrolase (decyclizing) [Deltaproteobacteria bacterium]